MHLLLSVGHQHNTAANDRRVVRVRARLGLLRVLAACCRAIAARCVEAFHTRDAVAEHARRSEPPVPALVGPRNERVARRRSCGSRPFAGRVASAGACPSAVALLTTASHARLRSLRVNGAHRRADLAPHAGLKVHHGRGRDSRDS